MDKVGGVEQMLDDFINGRMVPCQRVLAKFCTKFGRRVASLACHLALINTPFRAY